MKSQIPTRVPGIFPGIRHQDHVIVAQMFPGTIASMPSFFGRRWFRGIAREPAKNVLGKELLGPRQTGKRLPPHRMLVSGELGRMHSVIELIGFSDTLGED